MTDLATEVMAHETERLRALPPHEPTTLVLKGNQPLKVYAMAFTVNTEVVAGFASAIEGPYHTEGLQWQIPKGNLNHSLFVTFKFVTSDSEISIKDLQLSPLAHSVTYIAKTLVCQNCAIQPTPHQLIYSFNVAFNGTSKLHDPKIIVTPHTDSTEDGNARCSDA